MHPKKHVSSRPVSTAWRLVWTMATLAAAVQLVAALVTGLTSAGELRLPALFVAMGGVVLRGLAAYGVFNRTRWGLWLGALLALASLPLPLVLSASIQAPGAVLETGPASAALAWSQALLGLGFLLGLIALRCSPKSTPGPLK